MIKLSTPRSSLMKSLMTFSSSTSSFFTLSSSILMLSFVTDLLVDVVVRHRPSCRCCRSSPTFLSMLSFVTDLLVDVVVRHRPSCRCCRSPPTFLSMLSFATDLLVDVVVRFSKHPIPLRSLELRLSPNMFCPLPHPLKQLRAHTTSVCLNSNGMRQRFQSLYDEKSDKNKRETLLWRNATTFQEKTKWLITAIM